MKRLFLVAVFLCLAIPETMRAAAVEVTISKDDKGNFTLVRGGQPYFIRGAGGTDHLALLKECGGNSIRTWGIESLEKQVDGKRLIDRCADLGLTVAAGIWIGHASQGFDYSNPVQIRRQRDAVRAAVRKYKDCPALLVWGLGNEMEGPTSDGRDAQVWKELNKLAAIVKEEDPHHPVMTVIAGAARHQSKEHSPILSEPRRPRRERLRRRRRSGRCGEGGGVAETVRASRVWPLGTLGSSQDPMGRSDRTIEPRKGRRLLRHGEIAYRGRGGRQPGQLLLPLGTEAGNHLDLVWHVSQVGRKTAAGRCHVPRLDRQVAGEPLPARCSFRVGVEGSRRCAGKLYVARMKAADPDGDKLSWEWTVTAESTDIRVGGDKESVPRSFPKAVESAKNGEAAIRTPNKPGNYRVFAIVRDGKGGASVENFCFRVEAP